MNSRIINTGEVGGIDVSLDGKYQIYIRDDYPGEYRVSDDFGATFHTTVTGITRYLKCAAISGDGRYQLIGSGNSNYLMISNDFGQTFTTSTAFTAGQVNDIRISLDGKYHLLSTWRDGIYISDDYGATYTQRVIDHMFNDCDMSQSGEVMAAVGEAAEGTQDAYIYVSTDYGVTWNYNDLNASDSGYNTPIAVSADGTVLVTSDRYGVVISTNSGANWTTTSLTNGVFAASCSADGQFIILGQSNNLRISSDGGSSWVSHAITFDCRNLIMSASGQYIIAGSPLDGGDWLSSNYGGAWSLKTSNSSFDTGQAGMSRVGGGTESSESSEFPIQTVNINLGDGTWNTDEVSGWNRICQDSPTTSTLSNSTGAASGWTLSRPPVYGVGEGVSAVATQTGYPVGVTEKLQSGSDSKDGFFELQGMDDTKVYQVDIFGSVTRGWENDLGTTIVSVESEKEPTNLSYLHKDNLGDAIKFEGLIPHRGLVVLSFFSGSGASAWYLSSIVIREFNP